MKNFIPYDDKLIKPKDPPWITKNIKSFYNKYKRKFKQFVRNGSQIGQKPSIDALKQEYTNMVEKSQEKYLKSLGDTLANPQTGPKKYWTALKKLLKKNKSSIIPPILQNDIFITDTEQKCNVFNEYFKDQCKTIETDSTLPPNVDKITESAINLVNFSENSILDHIRGLNINKAHGYDDISIRMLKICDKSITRPLYIIFKSCLNAGYFPKAWKKANVIPLHKKNNKNIVSNYRPVSLLPICGKIFEKIIFDKLYTHIYSNDLISDKQSGYKKNDSTIKQLLAITHDIYKAFDYSPPREVRATFLDISRAFDRVWHDGLLHKLKQNGIEGEMLSILASFLAEREQRVIIDGNFSGWSNIEAGVPQGSILGPILFLVYINDLIDTVDSEIKIFADDTFIYRIVDQDSTEKLNQDLEKITVWANTWKMVFNPSLSKQAVEVCFSSKRTPSVFEILEFNGIPVLQASGTKHLGLLLDLRLDFKKHLAEKLGKANQGLGVMKQLYKWTPRRSLEEIYKLYTRPHVDYGDIIYDIADLNKNSIFTSTTSNLRMENIEKIQYQAARIVSGAWQGTSREKLYDDLGWESLQNRRTVRKLCILYETLKNRYPRYLSEILDDCKYRQGSRYFDLQMLKNIPCRTNKFKATCLPSAIRDWNLLSFETKTAVSKQAFKNQILKLTRPKKNLILASWTKRNANILLF